MTDLGTSPLGSGTSELDESAHPLDAPEVRAADRWLLIGALLCGTMVAGPLGTIPLLVGLTRNRRLLGSTGRPWSVVVIGTFCMIDASLNFFAWTLDTFASTTVIGHTFITGYGRMFDGAFFVHYGSGPLGGVANPSEKMWQYLAIAIVMPLRFVAAWAFIQMRTWGLHFMKVTGWLYLMLWVGYTMVMALEYEERFGRSLYGVPGWWLFNLFYLSPLFTIPYLYTVDQRRWGRGRT